MKKKIICHNRAWGLEQVLEFLRCHFPHDGTDCCPICRRDDFSIDRKTQRWWCASGCGVGDFIDLLMKGLRVNEAAAASAYSELCATEGPHWWTVENSVKYLRFEHRAEHGTYRGRSHRLKKPNKLRKTERVDRRNVTAGYKQPTK